jgi:hypothetical protein
MTPERRYAKPMSDDEAPIWNEPEWMAGLNDLGEVIEAINRALQRPERFTSHQLSSLAGELQKVARRYGVWDPHD